MFRSVEASQVLPFSAGYRNPKTISVGPLGGKGGNSWDDAGYAGIRKIIVAYGHAIDSINIEYERNRAFVWSKRGGRGGNTSEKIELDYPRERITSISGHYDIYLRSLTFESNMMRRYGPYGDNWRRSTYFSFSIAEGEIVGFHGRSGWYIDCLGVYISNLQAPAIPKSLKPISVGPWGRKGGDMWDGSSGGKGGDMWDGPWGGEGGDMWDDGVYSGIHQIEVVCGDAIDSINIEYDNNGSSFWLKHGGSTTNKIQKIQLDYPREILTSISGHYDTYLRSLTFKSNLNEHGPYGRQQGTYFSFPISDGKIVGFHGRSGSYLDCIGVYLSNLHTAVPPESNTVISVAPWGGEGGDQWDDGACAGVRQIILVHGQAINSIQIEYERDGSSVWSRHGGTEGNKADMIILDYPRESLISISGHYDNYLRQLSFESNLKKYGPYGVDEGTYFSFPMTGGRIVGFHGKSGPYLDSIGVHISDLHYSVSSQSNTVISIGPWGGKGGDQWRGFAPAGVRQIILVHGEAIDSIQIEYERDGRSVWSRHGGRGGNKTDRIILDYPRESLISISGHYDNYLRSLSFESNLKKYGPYGVKQGTYFSFPMTDGRIVGFHGKCRQYLDSIGVYISNLHYSIPKQIISAGPWGGNSGDGWYDRVYTGIRQIILVHGDFIDSINIEYEKDGRSVWSKHGGIGGIKTDKIQLDYSRGESLTSISGYYDNYLTSLTLVSNYKEYGPYGVERGTYFSCHTEGKIVSFHGRSGYYLHCIGVYLSNV